MRLRALSIMGVAYGGGVSEVSDNDTGGNDSGTAGLTLDGPAGHGLSLDARSRHGLSLDGRPGCSLPLGIGCQPDTTLPIGSSNSSIEASEIRKNVMRFDPKLADALFVPAAALNSGNLGEPEAIPTVIEARVKNGDPDPHMFEKFGWLTPPPDQFKPK